MRLNVASVCERKYMVRAREYKEPFTFSQTRYVNGTLAMEYIMITMIAIFVVIVPRLYAETFKSDPFVQSLSH